MKKTIIVSKKGFSLVEIMIVLMIIGSILGIALPRLLNKPQKTSQTFKVITQKFKEVRNRAKFYGTSYRFAFRLTEGQQAYWVEKSSQVYLIDKKALEAIREKEKSQFRAEEDTKSPTDFQPDNTIFKNEQKLPEGFTFKSIESASLDSIFTDGTAYIHFFPQGYIEPSAIQILDPKKNIWTLVFNPITGQADIIEGEKSLKDISR